MAYKFSELSPEAQERAIKEYHWIIECDDGHHGDEPFEHDEIKNYLLEDNKDNSVEGVVCLYLFDENGEASNF